MSKILLENISSNVVVLFVRVAITFVMTPIYLRVLGSHDYGIWEILAAVIGYMGILDIGIKPTVGRYIAMHHARGDTHAINQVFSTACLFMLGMGLLSAALVMGGGYYWLLHTSSEHDSSRYMLLFSLIAIHLVTQFPSLVTDGALEGFQKYTLKNSLLIIKSVMIAAFVYYFIELYDGLLVLAMVSTAGMVIKYFIGAALLRMPRNGGLAFSLHDVSLAVFFRSLRFGGKSFIQGMASRVQIGSDRIIIGYFLGPAMVPLYSIPANLIGYIRNIGWTITDAFMPYFTSLQAKDEQQALRQVYFVASRFCIGLLLPMSIGTILIGGPFIGVWLGSEYQQDAEIVILLLVLFTMLPFLNPFSTRYLTALGKHGLLARLYPVTAVLNIILSLALVRSYGIGGVAMGTLLPMLLLVPIVLKSTCRSLDVSVAEYINKSIVPCLPPALVLIVVVGALRYYLQLSSYPELLLAVLLGATSYSCVFLVTGLKSNERNWLFARLRNSMKVISRFNTSNKIP